SVSFRHSVFDRGVSLSDETISGCSFDHARLHGVKFYNSDLRTTTFVGAKMRFAELSGADLRGCDFRLADLGNAHLPGAVIDETTDFRGANLTDAFTSEIRDNSGKLVLPSAKMHLAQMDLSTRTGSEPRSYERAWLREIIKDARAYRESWSHAM